MIELVVTDLDGTFWEWDLTFPDAHRSACQALRAAGIPVLAATARRRMGVAAIFADTGLDLPAVLLNGALGADLRGGHTFHTAPFTPEVAAATLTAFREHGLDPTVYVDDPAVDAVLSPTPSTCPAHRHYLAPMARTGDLDEATDTDTVLGFGLIGLPHAVLAPVAGRLAGLGVAPVLFSEPVYGGYGLNVGPPDVSKWTGVVAYCRAHDIDPGAVLAVGDGDNDVDMLREASVAVAVRTGTAACMAEADHLIDPPEEGGWAEVARLVRDT